jgi:hypothetical protein
MAGYFFFVIKPWWRYFEDTATCARDAVFYDLAKVMPASENHAAEEYNACAMPAC